MFVKKSEYARMEEYEQTYWWHLGRLKIIQTYIKRATKHKKNLKILNVGCGTGGTIDMLESFGAVDNVDNSDDALAFMKQKGYKNLYKVEGVKLPFPDNAYDIVGAFDVLEHIENEHGALGEWRRVLKPGGSVVLTVPAYQWLWSDHDVSLHHKRRYTTGRLTAAAKTAGFIVDRKSYAIVFSLPLIVGFRFLHKATGRKTDSETSYVKVSEAVNTLFTNALAVEAKVHGGITFPTGTTVIGILRKADD
jgi:ubiquinone/menaquinone biosynthesis C-methylase UbiE